MKQLLKKIRLWFKTRAISIREYFTLCFKIETDEWYLIPTICISLQYKYISIQWLPFNITLYWDCNY